MTTAENKAVFLSYASQDAEAAKRICEALRAAGVEVWFDQNELVGGDAWDAKIRKQIKECALFVPVISANTQARREGYFRLEWKLADDRTHLMARGTPFIVPICVDNTKEGDALVPDSFMVVQWTRMIAGQESSAFVAQMKSLLGASGEASRGDRSFVGEPHRHSIPRVTRPPRRGLLLLAGAAIGVGVWYSLPWSSYRQPQAAPTTLATAASSPAAPLTETQILVARIWAIFAKEQNGTPEEWALSEDLGAKATTLEPTNAAAWAAYACATYGGTFTSNREVKKATALRRAERAVGLDPRSYEARFALAHLHRTEQSTLAAAEKTFRELLNQAPADQRVLRGLAYTLRDQAYHERVAEQKDQLTEESFRLLDRSVALPGGDAGALVGKAGMLADLHRYREAKAAYDASLKSAYGPNAFGMSVLLLYAREGKVADAVEQLQQAPPDFWQKDFQASMATWLWLCAGKPNKALETVRLVREDLFEVPSQRGSFNGPKALLVGLVHEAAGKRNLAEIEWRSALLATEQRLAAKPNEAKAFFWKAWLLAALGKKDDARRALQLYEEYTNRRGPSIDASLRRGFDERASMYLRLGEFETVIDALEMRAEEVRNPEIAAVLWNRLRMDPTWDVVRENPRFIAVMMRFGELARSGDASP